MDICLALGAVAFLVCLYLWVAAPIYPVDRKWNAELRRCMELHRFEPVYKYMAKIGPHEVWIANHPYASFRPLIKGAVEDKVPRRSTTRVAMCKYLIDKAFWEENQKKGEKTQQAVEAQRKADEHARQRQILADFKEACEEFQREYNPS